MSRPYKKSKARDLRYVQKAVRKVILRCFCRARVREPAGQNPGIYVSTLGFSPSGPVMLLHSHSFDDLLAQRSQKGGAFFDVVATTAPLSSLLIITEVLQNATGWIFSHIGRSSRPEQPRFGFWAIGPSISVVQRQGRTAQILGFRSIQAR